MKKVKTQSFVPVLIYTTLLKNLKDSHTKIEREKCNNLVSSKQLNFLEMVQSIAGLYARN